MTAEMSERVLLLPLAVGVLFPLLHPVQGSGQKALHHPILQFFAGFQTHL